jgi:hypothetical protein
VTRKLSNCIFGLVAVACLGVLPGCRSSSKPENGTLKCGPDPYPCPSGYYCYKSGNPGQLNTCWRNGTSPPDAGMPDASVPADSGVDYQKPDSGNAEFPDAPLSPIDSGAGGTGGAGGAGGSGGASAIGGTTSSGGSSGSGGITGTASTTVATGTGAVYGSATATGTATATISMSGTASATAATGTGAVTRLATATETATATIIMSGTASALVTMTLQQTATASTTATMTATATATTAAYDNQAGLAAYYKLEAPSGSNYADATTNHLDATATSVSTATGAIAGSSYGARFGSSTSRIQTPYLLPTGTATSRGFTMSVWAKPAALAARMDILNAYGMTIYTIPPDSEHGSYALCSGGDRFIGGLPIYNPVLVENQWVHIVCTYTNADSPIQWFWQLWLNGKPLDSTSGTYPARSSNPLTMSDSAYPYLGDIDEVRIYERGLSAAEILNLYTCNMTVCASTATTTITATATGTISQTATQSVSAAGTITLLTSSTSTAIITRSATR